MGQIQNKLFRLNLFFVCVFLLTSKQYYLSIVCLPLHQIKTKLLLTLSFNAISLSLSVSLLLLVLQSKETNLSSSFPYPCSPIELPEPRSSGIFIVKTQTVQINCRLKAIMWVAVRAMGEKGRGVGMGWG